MRIHSSSALALAFFGIVASAGCTNSATGSGTGTGASSSGTPGGGSSGAGGSSGSSSSSGSSGTPVTLGSDLSNEPTSAYRCSDGYPIQTNPSFPQPFYAAGASSCTLLTFQAMTTPSPGSGMAVSAKIRVGAVTGPMRFLKMRILFKNGVGPQCCSLEQYGDTFTPKANDMTTVPLGFDMVEDHVPAANDLDTIAKNDIIALEVLSPTVPIPGYWPANGGAVTGIANYVWLPSLTAAKTQAPSNVLLNYSGSFSGFVPLFSIAYVPTG